TGVLAPGGPPEWTMRNRYSGAVTGGTGPISATLLPPGVAPPSGPSVNSQTLPAASTASDVGPAAACALASAGKFSICQSRGPAGSSLSFFSATGLMTNFSCAVAVGCNVHNPDTNAATTPIRNCFMGKPPWSIAMSNSVPDSYLPGWGRRRPRCRRLTMFACPRCNWERENQSLRLLSNPPGEAVGAVDFALMRTMSRSLSCAPSGRASSYGGDRVEILTRREHALRLVPD